jgi:hypothetical protein
VRLSEVFYRDRPDELFEHLHHCSLTFVGGRNINNYTRVGVSFGILRGDRGGQQNGEGAREDVRKRTPPTHDCAI